MLFALLAFVFIWEGFNHNKYWILAGIFTSLAYLAKAIGIALIPGFVISVFLVYRFKIFKNKFFWAFFFTFFLIASPLLIRNTLLYQNPFFNYNAYIVKYGVEKFEKIQYVVFNMSEGSSIWKFDETAIGDNLDNKLNTNKSTSNIFTRTLKVIKAFITSFNILQNYFGGKSFWISALILIILFLIGLSKLANKGMRYFIVSTIFVFLFLLSFNPVPRYFLVLIPLIWICIGLGVVSSIDYIFKKLSSDSKIRAVNLSIRYALILFLILFIVLKIQKLNLSNPFNTVDYSESRLEILKWLDAHLDTTDKYTLGPNFYWQLNKGTWILPPNAAKYKDISKLERFVRKHDVRYIIFDRDILLKYHSIDLIKNNFSIDPSEGLKEIMPIDDWQLIYKDAKKPVDYLIYEAQNKNHS
jgi:4-amino-4-deoxy-L-arabinose transferase-like glycosyltransferase